ncbi:pathogenesis-related thaumatin-like protein 3.5 [Cryptomeria japonica]|uniref:pathogenesis-related thaumatin-like protein 3.5 n=1 Tax=Cryptomeria japonica TaxID=3369 RepID=UPI0027DA2C87|nr:pathogenesis-related thaumatin-like protein 3.5 [Cryptomeria japonica]
MSIVGIIVLLTVINGAWAVTFTLVNNCEYTVWPGFLSNGGVAALGTTGFELPASTSRVVETPAKWSGRMWGRTGCSFDSQGKGKCATGDCGGQLQCGGAGADPPATLAEFAVDPVTQDFYDVSLVDGYNLPILVVATGGTGSCLSTGCINDINRNCPTELQIDDGVSRVGTGGGNVLACKSACGAFDRPEYCCSGAYANPDTCKPSTYSQVFKAACPRAYSYAFDDRTSTFTCTAADYTVTFCPTVAMASQKLNTPPASSGTAYGESAVTSLSTSLSMSMSMCIIMIIFTFSSLLIISVRD